MIQLHLAVLLFGFSGLFGKLLSIPVTAIVLGRTVIAALSLVALLMVRRNHIPLTWRLARTLFPSGVLLALHWFTFFYAIQISSVATGLLSFSTFPVFVAFLDPFFSHRSIQRLDIVFAFVVFCGLVLIVPSFDFSNRFFQGVLWGLASAITFALLTLFNRRFVANTDAVVVGLFQNFWAAVCLSAFWPQLIGIDTSQLLLIIVLGVLCTALAHTLFIASLKTVRPQLASVTACLEPVYGIVTALLILGEYPQFREVMGGCLIITVVATNSWRDSSSTSSAIQENPPG